MLKRLVLLRELKSLEELGAALEGARRLLQWTGVCIERDGNPVGRADQP